MLLALIIRSSYTENGVVAAREAFEDTGSLVQAKLSSSHYGLNVATLLANRELPEHLERLLTEYAGRLDGLLIHYTGYLAVKPDRGPALLLDGNRLRAFPLSRLRAAIAAAARHSFVLMDVIAIAEHVLDLNGVVSDLGTSLNESAAHVAVMSSVALPEQIEPNRRGCARLSDLWLLSLDCQFQRANGAPVYCESVVRGVQSEPLSFANLPSFDYRPSEPDFVLVPGLKASGHIGQDEVKDRITLQSVLVSPEPKADFGPISGERTAHGRNDTLPDDAMVDSQPATQVTDDDLVKDEAETPIAPTSSRRPVAGENSASPLSAPPSASSRHREDSTLRGTLDNRKSSPDSSRERDDTLPGAARPSYVHSERAPRSSQPADEDPIDRGIDWADRLAYRGDTTSAVAEYERLIQELKPKSDTRLSTLYANLGGQYRKLGELAHALTAFEESLALDPRDDVAHKGACDIHRERRDWDSLSQTVRRRLHTTTDAHEKTDLLDRLAEIWLNHANDPKRAISVIEERLAITPNDIPTLERMIEAYDRDGDTFARIAQREKLASVLESFPAQKSLLLVESATIALQQLNSVESAQSFVDRAIEADPKSVEAFELSIEILNRQKLWPEVLRYCVRILSDSSGPELRYQAACRLLDLVEARGPSIDISDTAVERLEVAVSDDEELKQRAMNVLANRDAYAKTTATLQNALALDSRHAASLQELSDAAVQQRDADMAAMASSMLVCLQCGRPQDVERAALLVTDKVVEAKRSLNDDDFTEQLLVHDVDIAIFRTLGDLHKSMGLMPAADGDGAQSRIEASGSGAGSTESLARTLASVAGLVGVELPGLVMLPEHETPLELNLAARPRLLVGMELASRLPAPQLAFLGASRLGQLRHELVWRAAVTNQERLATILSLCVRFARDGRSCVESVADQALAGRFVSHLETAGDLAERVTQLFKGYAPITSVWEDLARRCYRAADRSLLRVGVVLSGNPSQAYEVAKLYPLASSLSLDDQLDEIARFATSRDHQTLRRNLGIDVAMATYRNLKSLDYDTHTTAAP